MSELLLDSRISRISSPLYPSCFPMAGPVADLGISGWPISSCWAVTSGNFPFACLLVRLGFYTKRDG